MAPAAHRVLPSALATTLALAAALCPAAARAHFILDEPACFSEQDNLKSALADIGSQLRQARDRQARLKAEVKYLEAKRDAPPDASDASVDEQFYSELSARIESVLNNKVDAFNSKSPAAKG